MSKVPAPTPEPEPKSSPSYARGRREGAIEALDFAIRIVTNFNKDEALARLSNLRQGYKRR